MAHYFMNVPFSFFYLKNKYDDSQWNEKKKKKENEQYRFALSLQLNPLD